MRDRNTTQKNRDSTAQHSTEKEKGIAETIERTSERNRAIEKR